MTDRKFSLLRKEQQWVLCCGDYLADRWKNGQPFPHRYLYKTGTHSPASSRRGQSCHTLRPKRYNSASEEYPIIHFIFRLEIQNFNLKTDLSSQKTPIFRPEIKFFSYIYRLLTWREHLSSPTRILLLKNLLKSSSALLVWRYFSIFIRHIPRYASYKNKKQTG